MSMKQPALPHTAADILQHYEAGAGRPATALERWAAGELAALMDACYAAGRDGGMLTVQAQGSSAHHLARVCTYAYEKGREEYERLLDH